MVKKRNVQIMPKKMKVAIWGTRSLNDIRLLYQKDLGLMPIYEMTSFFGKRSILFETPSDILAPPFRNAGKNLKLDGINGIQMEWVLGSNRVRIRSLLPPGPGTQRYTRGVAMKSQRMRIDVGPQPFRFAFLHGVEGNLASGLIRCKFIHEYRGHSSGIF